MNFKKYGDFAGIEIVSTSGPAIIYDKVLDIYSCVEDNGTCKPLGEQTAKTLERMGYV